MTVRRSLHPAIAWTLVATVLASAWSLWWPQESDNLRPLAVRAAYPSRPVPPSSPTARASVTDGATDTRRLLSPAERDPFNSTPAPVPQGTLPAVAQQPTQPEPPLAAPEAPPMQHRVIGRFRSPEGVWMVFLMDGDVALPAAPGLALSSGWVVDSINGHELKLQHPRAELPVILVVPGDNPGQDGSDESSSGNLLQRFQSTR